MRIAQLQETFRQALTDIPMCVSQNTPIAFLEDPKHGWNRIPLPTNWYLRSDGSDARVLAGRTLRYWLLRHLDQNPGTHKVAHLVAAINRAGYKLNGRPSKTVSDALHTETDRGRVTRTAWGHYAITRPLPRSTRYRIEGTIRTHRACLYQHTHQASTHSVDQWLQSSSQRWIPWKTRHGNQPSVYLTASMHSDSEKSLAQRETAKTQTDSLRKNPSRPSESKGAYLVPL